jgi:hypothetical protein
MRAALAITILAAAASPLAGETVLGAGSHLSVRLAAPVSSRTSKAGDVVQASVVAAVDAAGPLTPHDASVVGRVVEVGRLHKPDRAMVRLEFSSLAGRGETAPLCAHLVSVDNAREVVDDEGRIVLRSPHLRPSWMEALLLLAHVDPMVAVAVEAGRIVHRVGRPSSIELPAGTEVTLELDEPAATVALEADPDAAPIAPALADLVRAEPRRVLAASGKTPADVVNMTFVGTADEIRAAFVAAGWRQADRACLRSGFKLLWAFAEARSYRSAPVSRLSLDGRPPDLVFEKQLDTISKRHHVRLWKRNETWEGRPVFVATASRDVGLFLSRDGPRITHHIEPWIDTERDKIVEDLSFAGYVASTAKVDRPAVEVRCHNTAGDLVLTDGRAAVVVVGTPGRQEMAAGR